MSHYAPPAEASECTVTCSGCRKGVAAKPTNRGNARTPRGWKVTGERLLCQTCKKTEYALRAPCVPVAKPVDMTWAEFHPLLREQWQLTSQCATWLMREFYVRDEQRGKQPKLGSWKPPYLYPEARERFPDIPPTTLTAIINLVQSKYRTQRYGVVWTLSEQLQTLRYPQPFLVPSRNWSVEISDDARRDMLLNVRIGGQWVQLRLRGGKDFIRQRRDIEAIISGAALKGELSIYRKRAFGTDRAGKNGQQSSALGSERGDGGQRIKYDVMVKFAGYYPRKTQPQRSGRLIVRSDTLSMLVCLNERDERLWVLNADQLRRWCAEHASRLQRWSDDQKQETRPVPAFAERRAAAVVKFRNRMRSFEQQAAAQIVGLAKRRRLAEVVYDDSERGYLERFDWSGLKTAIGQKCAAEGILFSPRTASVEVPSESLDDAREVDHETT